MPAGNKYLFFRSRITSRTILKQPIGVSSLKFKRGANCCDVWQSNILSGMITWPLWLFEFLVVAKWEPKLWIRRVSDEYSLFWYHIIPKLCELHATTSGYREYKVKQGDEAVENFYVIIFM